MSNFLQSMAASSAERAALLPVYRDADFDTPLVALSLHAFDVIAEIKGRSPAEGRLAGDEHNRVKQAQQYAQGGAAAISVLTEPSRFDGALSHLAEVAAAAPTTPVMCKDFLVETRQIDAARQAGASGVLLIATMLDDRALADMLACAYAHEMFVLLEAFDSPDLGRAAALLELPQHAAHAERGTLLIGVNTRNLRTLEVDNERLRQLAPELPNARCVAESGLKTSDDAATVAELGYRLALVGSALMRHAAPSDLVSDMCRAGRERLAA